MVQQSIYNDITTQNQRRNTMNCERIKEKIDGLRKSFWKREKNKITPDDLAKMNMEEIKAWAWGTSMGSDAFILLIKNDGAVLNYDHYKYSKDFDAFAKMEESLLSQTEEWLLYRCNFRNNLYIRVEDKVWFDHCWKNIISPSNRNPYIAVECICQKIF